MQLKRRIGLLNKIGGSLLLLTLLTACSGKSEADITKELQTVTSWAATAEMTGEAWIQGNVPTAYAKQTLSTAQKKLHKQTERLAHTSYDPRQRRTILELLGRLESTVAQMSTAVEQKDRTALALLDADITQQLQQLSSQKQSIKTLAKTAGGQP